MHSWAFRLLIVAGVAAASLALWLILPQLGLPDALSPDALAAWLRGSGPWGPIFLMTLMTIAVVIGPIPTLPISAASGLAFGVVGGTLLAALGASIGALIALFIARLLARDLVRAKLGDNPILHADASQRTLFLAVFFTRLIPLFSFALISYAAGLTAIRPGRFLLASFLGMLPMTVVYAGLGHSIQIHPALTVIAAGLLLLLMTVAPYYIERQQKERLSRWFAVPVKPSPTKQQAPKA